MFRAEIFSKIYRFIGLILLVIGVGTAGYRLIEGWSFIDSFYMTIITISTVGFREIGEMGVNGKLFTAFLIISSFGTFAYAITSITRYLVGGEYRAYIKEYKFMKEINRMDNHVIICGFGRVGLQVANDINASGGQSVIIEKDAEVIEHYDSHGAYVFLKGDSTDDESLNHAGVQRARAIIVCMPKDADNIYVVLAAREQNPDILIVSRASQNTAVSKLKMAGANNVIMPDSIGGSHMASLIANPDVMEFLDIIRVHGNEGSNMDTITYEQLPAEFRDLTVGELESREITGVTIIGFKGPEGKYQINPALNTKVIPGSKLFVLGSPAQIKKFTKYFKLGS